VGVEHPDITNASSAIKKSEIEKCQKNGVTGIVEVKIGSEGDAIANDMKLKCKENNRNTPVYQG
jgi:phosphate transport system substrate-binding protein